MKLAVVADDLTGAMDTGVQFAKCGLQAVLMLAQRDLASADALVVSTDSRGVTATEAYSRSKALGCQLAERIVYKKIDSTMRGNIGPELEGLLDGLGLLRALVTPAFPPAGRTVVDGYLRVHGTLLAESAFARDPLWPARESHVPTLLARQSKRTVGHLPLSVVTQGKQVVIDALSAEPAPIVAADAATEGHLSTLAHALANLRSTWLPCGSAGLAQEWPVALGVKDAVQTAFSWHPSAEPVLVIAGSRHPATARQLEHALDEGKLRLVSLSLANNNWREQAQARLPEILRQQGNVALSTTFSEFVDGQAGATAQMLADAAAWVLERVPLAGLVITGGDTARAVCCTLGATALRILGEVQAGVPAGTLISGAYDGLRVVTKAGGFGDDWAIVQSIDRIQGANP